MLPNGRYVIGLWGVTFFVTAGLAFFRPTHAPAQSHLPGNVVDVLAGDYFLEAPDTLPAGLTTFQLRLQSGGHALWVMKLEDGRTVADFVASFKNRTPRPWALNFGGPGFPSTDRPANATMILEPGNYVLADVMNEEKYDGTGHLSKGMYRALTVVPANASAEEPTPDVRVRMTDTSFELSKPLMAGRRVLRVDNAGTRSLEFKIRRLLPGKTAKDLLSWRRGSGTPEPAEAWGGFADFAAGRHLTTTLDFPPGEYVITSCCGQPRPAPMVITVPRAQPAKPTDDVPPLVEAVWTQDVESVKRLMAEGADPNATTASGNGRPAWMWAIVARDPLATAVMLSKVTNVDKPDALLFAANRNDVVLARALLDRRLLVDARGLAGTTALLVAAASGHVETIRLLLERGADVNLADDFGDTPLMAAVRAGSLPSIQRLLAAGADLNARDQSGRTALTWAARTRRADAVDMLRSRGAAGDTTGPGPAHVPLAPRAAVERSLPLIQRGTATWDERQRCAGCHHHPLMFRTTALARRLGFAVDGALLRAQVDRFQSPQTRKAGLQRQAAMKEALASDAGALRWSLRNGGDTSFGGPWFLSSLLEAGVREASAETETLLIARMQLRDGRWRHGLARVPIESSDFTATAIAVKVLQASGARSETGEIAARLERAASWMRTTTPETTDDMSFRLFGLHWTDSDETVIGDAVTKLRNEQNADGGWGQLRGLNSDAYATGLVLVALHEAGQMRVDDPTYQRGVRFLVETQESDGSWLVHKRAVPLNDYFESGFPHGKFQFISYAGTCWATMALMHAAADPAAK